MKKRIASFLLALCTLCTLMTVPAAAKTNTLVALGDSISTGYGLEGYTPTPMPYAQDSFVNLLAAEVGYTPVNLAVDGLTAEKLAAGLQSMSPEASAAISSATVISLTVGGNDLLQPLYLAIATAFSLDPTSPTLVTDIQQAVSAAIASGDPVELAKIQGALQALGGELGGIATSYGTNLLTIITALKTANPAATIIVQTIANPYRDIDGLSDSLDAGVQALNGVILQGSATGAYLVADVYTVFQQSEEILTNATSPETPLDPHPNQAGHALIAQTAAALFEEEPLPFRDVAENDWFYGAVRFVYEQGLFHGTAPDLFSPNQNMTRGMFVTVLGRLSNVDTAQFPNSAFGDVPADAYYSPYVAWAAACGIIQGTSPSTFAPDRPISRQEMAVILANFFDFVQQPLPQLYGAASFVDSDQIAPWALEAVTRLQMAGVLQGKGNNRLDPTGSATRAETATMLQRCLMLMAAGTEG